MTRAGYSHRTAYAAIWATLRFFAFATALCLCWSSPAFAAPVCEKASFDDVAYTACVVDPSIDQIRLFHTAPDGTLIGTFGALRELLAQSDTALVLAMNGGMYHPDRRPVGYYVDGGHETAPLVLREGPGNFGLLPNGVFCLTGAEAQIVESRAFAELELKCDYATQSGPLMVEDDALHPRFLPDSTSELIRNGVGVRHDGQVVMAISDQPLNFDTFARLFRDKLGTPDALYLDGRVSRLYAPALGRIGIGLPMGPIMAVTAPAD